MKWRICILLAGLPPTYPILLASYYVAKYLREVNIKEVVKRNKELFQHTVNAHPTFTWQTENQ